MSDERAQARAMVCELIDEIDGGSPDTVAEMVDRLTESGPGQRTRLRAVLAELLDVGASAVTLLTGEVDDIREVDGAAGEDGEDDAADPTYAVELCDGDGEPIDIDELAPPTRALIRALLARLAGRDDDMAVQIDFALASGEREDAAEVLSMALMWTLDALARSER